MCEFSGGTGTKPSNNVCKRIKGQDTLDNLQKHRATFLVNTVLQCLVEYIFLLDYSTLEEKTDDKI